MKDSLKMQSVLFTDDVLDILESYQNCGTGYASLQNITDVIDYLIDVSMDESDTMRLFIAKHLQFLYTLKRDIIRISNIDTENMVLMDKKTEK